MGCSTIKNVWIGRSNSLLFLFQTAVDGVSTPYPLDGVLQIDLLLSSGDTLSVLDGDGDGYLDWWTPALGEGEMKLVLGPWMESVGVVPGLYTGSLVVYSPSSPDGVVWGDPKEPLHFRVFAKDGAVS